MILLFEMLKILHSGSVHHNMMIKWIINTFSSYPLSLFSYFPSSFSPSFFPLSSSLSLLASLHLSPFSFISPPPYSPHSLNCFGGGFLPKAWVWCLEVGSNQVFLLGPSGASGHQGCVHSTYGPLHSVVLKVTCKAQELKLDPCKCKEIFFPVLCIEFLVFWILCLPLSWSISIFSVKHNFYYIFLT